MHVSKLLSREVHRFALYPRCARPPVLCIILKTFASVKVKTVYVITNGVQWLFIFSVFHEFYLFPLFPFLRSFWGAIHTYFCENHALDCWRAGITPAKQHAHFSQTLRGDPLLCFQMWFVFKTLQTSSVVHVSMTSKPAWQKQNPSEQWVDMIDYVLRVSSGALGVVYT